MTLLHPERLWLLASLPLLAAAYWWLQRRRRQRAVRFTNVELLRSVAPARPAWRRHLPAAGLALGLVALVAGFAGPLARVRVPEESATVMLVIDTSASMDATDVSPSRLAAAVEAASRFVGDLPAQHRVGLVAFDSQARVLRPPTTDHGSVIDAIEGLTLGPGTAAGDGLYAAIGAITGAAGTPAAATPPADTGAGPDAEDNPGDGAAIVLLSDGVTTVGRDATDAAEAAAAAGIPVTTIAFGTEAGTVTVAGRVIPVPADPATMARVAEITAGRAFEAFSGEELASVYEDIGQRVGYATEERDAAGPLLGAATALLTVALGLGYLWNGRLA